MESKKNHLFGTTLTTKLYFTHFKYFRKNYPSWVFEGNEKVFDILKKYFQINPFDENIEKKKYSFEMRVYVDLSTERCCSDRAWKSSKVAIFLKDCNLNKSYRFTTSQKVYIDLLKLINPYAEEFL